MLPLHARVGPGVMAIRRYSTFPKAPVLLVPHHQIVLCHIPDTHWESLTLSTKMQSMYFAAPADFGIIIWLGFHIHIYHHHHHHLGPPGWISLTLSRYPSLSFFVPGRSSRLHPVWVQSSCM